MLSKRYWVALIITTMAASAGAQSSGPACSLGWSSGPMILVGGKTAYTLTAKSSHEQQLANGSFIRSFSQVQGAVASDGRTMSQRAQSCGRGEDGTLKLRYDVSVDDPRARTSLTWVVNGLSGMAKEAILYHFNPVDPIPRPGPAQLETPHKTGAKQPPSRSEFKNEELGTKKIAGVEAVGTRLTITTPPGEEGNELALVVTMETWRARDLGIVLLSINDDPRGGKSTYEVEELKFGEPDASLFTPPAGYAVRDIPPTPKGVVVAGTSATNAQQ